MLHHKASVGIHDDIVLADLLQRGHLGKVAHLEALVHQLRVSKIKRSIARYLIDSV